jgi:hypothetical protein
MNRLMRIPSVDIPATELTPHEEAKAKRHELFLHVVNSKSPKPILCDIAFGIGVHHRCYRALGHKGTCCCYCGVLRQE